MAKRPRTLTHDADTRNPGTEHLSPPPTDAVSDAGLPPFTSPELPTGVPFRDFDRTTLPALRGRPRLAFCGLVGDFDPLDLVHAAIRVVEHHTRHRESHVWTIRRAVSEAGEVEVRVQFVIDPTSAKRVCAIDSRFSIIQPQTDYPD